MSISEHDLVIPVVGLVIAVIGWFIKRDIARFERTAERQSELLTKHTESLNQIHSHLGQVLEVGKFAGSLDRFFGEKGGQARIWNTITELQSDVERLRERDHWFCNKLSVIKASMEVAGLKCGEPSNAWTLPDWEK